MNIRHGYTKEPSILSTKCDDLWYLGESWTIALLFWYRKLICNSRVYCDIWYNSIDYVPEICNADRRFITNFHIEIILFAIGFDVITAIAIRAAIYSWIIRFPWCTSIRIYGNLDIALSHLYIFQTILTQSFLTISLDCCIIFILYLIHFLHLPGVERTILSITIGTDQRPWFGTTRILVNDVHQWKLFDYEFGKRRLVEPCLRNDSW